MSTRHTDGAQVYLQADAPTHKTEKKKERERERPQEQDGPLLSRTVSIGGLTSSHVTCAEEGPQAQAPAPLVPAMLRSF